jgi:uncharacterized protein YdeI (YjbR/CyaY-like superfamily)
LRDEPLAEKTFNKASKKEQQEIIDWIVAAKNEEMKVERIARALDILVQGKSLNH